MTRTVTRDSDGSIALGARGHRRSVVAVTRVAIGGLTYEGVCTDAANARYDADRVRSLIADTVPERDIDAGVHVAMTLLDRGVLVLDGGREADEAGIEAHEGRDGALRVAPDAAVDDARDAAVDHLDRLDLATDPEAQETAVRTGMTRLHAVLVGVFEAALAD